MKHRKTNAREVRDEAVANLQRNPVLEELNRRGPVVPGNSKPVYFRGALVKPK